MLKRDICDAKELVAYLADCTLATVAGYAMKKSTPKHEMSRQISIAQTAVDLGRQLGVSFDTTRAAEVIAKHNGDCAAWAAKYMHTDQQKGVK